MSEQKAEQTSDETGSLGVEAVAAHSSDVSGEPGAAAAPEKAEGAADVKSPDLVPEQGGAGEAAKEAARAEAPKVDAPRSDADAPRIPGRLMIMSSDDRAWGGDHTDAKPESEPTSGMFGKRRFSALAAVVVLAAMAGAIGGALATAGLGYLLNRDSATANNSALEASVARIDADIVALKASVEHTSKMGVTQFNKTNDRLDKVEKAQAEPAAKLAKLSEAVDKLRAAPAPVAAASAAAKDVTGSISPPATAAVASVPLPLPKPEIARLPTVEGWVLRDVANGGALIEGRQGIYEVYAGDPVPGLGRVDAIRKQDGRWVVVTSRGLVVAR